MAELRVKVPIKFSEKAQRDLYETCIAYKELAEVRGAENEKLRELLSSYWKRTHSPVGPNVERDYLLELRELGIEVE